MYSLKYPVGVCRGKSATASSRAPRCEGEGGASGEAIRAASLRESALAKSGTWRRPASTFQALFSVLIVDRALVTVAEDLEGL